MRRASSTSPDNDIMTSHSHASRSVAHGRSWLIHRAVQASQLNEHLDLSHSSTLSSPPLRQLDNPFRL